MHLKDDGAFLPSYRYFLAIPIYRYLRELSCRGAAAEISARLNFSTWMTWSSLVSEQPMALKLQYIKRYLKYMNNSWTELTSSFLYNSLMKGGEHLNDKSFYLLSKPSNSDYKRGHFSESFSSQRSDGICRRLWVTGLLSEKAHNLWANVTIY
jgi:hypothetical protein